jgi:hypothetical protein
MSRNAPLEPLARALRGIGSALRRRPWTFALVALGVFALNLLLPPLLLAVTRKPWTYFAFNPWLKKLPEYLVSGMPLGDKVDFLTRVAVFWFTADGPYGAPEWGFAVDTLDLVRFLALALLFGAYGVLWLRARELGQVWGRHGTAGRNGGVVGALVGVLGLSTGPCSVVGCGAPVLPVLGLAFSGLSSGTLAILSLTSRVAAAAVLVLLSTAVLYLGWRVGNDRRAGG